MLDWARDALGARFVLIEGIDYAAQPAEALAAATAAIPSNPWRLGALASVMTITGSAVLALALNAGAFDADTIWAAAHVDEDWQMSQWGSDAEALVRLTAVASYLQASASA